MIGLTERQNQFLDWIVAYIQVNWRPPTLVEVAANFGVKPPSALDVIRALQKKGFLDESDGTARALRPINLAEASAGCIDNKLQRFVQSSESIAAVQGFEGFVRVSYMRIGSRPLFAVRVGDASMFDSGFYEGDLVIVRKQDTAEVNDIVIASVGFEAMMRHYADEVNGKIYLMPDYKDFETIIADKEKVTIYGVVVGLYREFYR